MTLWGWSSARAAWWAQRAGHRARRHLRNHSLASLVVRPPPVLPRGCRRWAVAVLRVRRDSCLVRSTVLQAWDAAHGRPRAVVIGVTAPGAGFKAHAWLDGEPAAASEGYTEVSRHLPPDAVTGARGQPLGSGGDGGHQPVEQAREIRPRP